MFNNETNNTLSKPLKMAIKTKQTKAIRETVK